MASGHLPLSSLPAAGRADDTVTIRARPGWQAVNLRELWQYRELLGILAGRDIKVRYKQTVLGALWAIIPPIFTMIIFTMIFGLLFGLREVDGIPYQLYAFTALVPWQLFANSLGQASNSLVGSQHLITKVYFPRLVIPLSSVLSALLDFAICFVLLLGFLVYYRQHVNPGWGLAVLPLLVVLALATALGVGLWLSALNVAYRDVRYVIPFIVQFWMYASPVLYPSARIPEQWRPLYFLNPMAGVIEGFRWAILGAAPPDARGVAVSLISVTALLVGGAYYFRRMEKSFADLV